MRRRILIVHPTLHALGGGADAVAAWTIEALKDEHDVSLTVFEPPDFEAMNRAFGTSIRPRDVCVRMPYPALRRLPLPWTASARFLAHQLCLRRAHAWRRGYDVIFSTQDEADLGGRGIQYVHFPSDFTLPLEPVPILERLRNVLSFAYQSLVLLAMGISFDRHRLNLTLVNSDFTGGVFRERFAGTETQTVYPPVPGDFPEVPWPEREHGFVCVGRIAPEKRLERIIDIVGAVRGRGHDLHLHIIGPAEHRSYAARIAALARENATWVRLEPPLSRADLTRLIARHRYGIHACDDEPFGIAVAEMARGGAIVFCPRYGGQSEIVGDERLSYVSREDAIEKIARVIEDADLSRALGAHLAARVGRFSAERFGREVREIVASFCDRDEKR